MPVSLRINYIYTDSAKHVKENVLQLFKDVANSLYY
jgi:hypothetical protein